MTRTPARRAAVPWSELAVMGLDPSLTGTGAALVRGGVLVKTAVITSDPMVPRPARLLQIRDGVQKFHDTAGQAPVLIAMETEAFGMPNQASALGAVQGILQVWIWEHLVPGLGHYLPVNVSHPKKWLGVKQKNEILLAVYKRYGVTFSDHNAADATVIAMIADSYLARKAGHEWPEWSRAQREVLAKLEATGFPWEAPPVKKGRKPKKAVS